MQERRQGIGAILDGLFAGARWLILPIALFLFLQWPMREIIRAYSRETNDAGQILFAFYVAVSLAAATRAGAHLTPGNIAGRYPPWLHRALAVAGVGLAILPWLAFLWWSSWPIVTSSLASLERFQDSGNQGYFLIKLALWVLIVVLGLASLVSPGLRGRGGDRS